MCKEKKGCWCGNQIIWFFDGKPTVIACQKCEIAVHCDDKQCPKCKGELTYFEADELAVESEVV